MSLWKLALGALLLFATNANAADVAGSKDHPLLKRYEGSEIIRYVTRSYDEYTVALGNGTPSGSFAKSEKVEGALTRIVYRVPAGHTSLELFRNYQKMLADAKFTTDFEQGAETFSWIGYFTEKFYWQSQTAGLGGETNPFNEHSIKLPRYLTAKLMNGDKQITVAVLVAESLGGDWRLPESKQPIALKAGEVLVAVDVIEGKAVEQKMTQIKSEDMAKALAATGKVDIYGILFDVDKTDIKPESAPTLEEVAKLLKGDAALKLQVAGHTDNTGTKEHNLKLSEGRASAVVQALVSTHSIDVARLKSVGYGDTKPVASNDTEEGRAKNRRVELSKL